MPGGILSRVRNALYDYGLLPVIRPAPFVISIGNLTWGGTGKTSLAAQLCQMLHERGYRVAILSRGYGRKSKGVIQVSDGQGPLCNWKDAGDEPYWLASAVPYAAVVVAEKRVNGLGVLESFQPDVIILDDGFQHRKMARDIDLLLVDSSEDILRQRVLPFGKLRESIHSVHRADAVILTHYGKAHRKTLKWFAAQVNLPVFHADYQPLDTSIAGKKVAAFCALGAPQHFLKLVEDCGAEIVFHHEFRDHHVYTGPDLASIHASAERAGAEALITTAKDAVKISTEAFRLPLLVLKVVLKVSEEEELHRFLLQRLPPPRAALREL